MEEPEIKGKEKEKEFSVKTSVWNEDIENVLKEIEGSCSNYRELCMASARYELRVYMALMYTMLIVSPLSGVLSTINLDYQDRVIQIFIIFFTFVSSILSAIIKFSKFEQKSTSHQTFASKYASLEGNIKRQLTLQKDDRVNAGKYLEWVSGSYEELFASMPLLPLREIKSEIKSEIKLDTKGVPETKSPSSPLVSVKISNMGKDQTVPDLNRYNDSKMKYEMARLELMANKK